MAEPQRFLRGLPELEPQGSYVRFRLFSAGSGLPNLREPLTCANCHRNTNTEGDPDSEAASEPPASPDTVEQNPSPKKFREKLYVRSNPDETQINDHVVCDDTSRTLTPPRALDHSRIACDLERVEVLLKLNGPAVADRPDVGDLCFALLRLPVKPEVIVAESHNSLAAAALKDLVRVKNEFVKTRR